MYRLGVGWESIVGGLYTLFGRGDVQIECGIVSLLVVLDCLFGRWGCAWWGSDVGCWDNGKGKENGSKSNV